MSREIKFRGFCIVHKRIHFPMYQLDDLQWTTDDHDISDDGPHGYEIMQYTGLKDKNGNPIFEGDIIKYDEDKDEIGIIKFIDGSFDVYSKDENLLYYPENRVPAEWEVIGNIYQNPELINN